MRRALSLLCLAALAVSGAAAVSPAAAAPAERADTSAVRAVPDELLVGYVAGATTGERDRARGKGSVRLAERVVAGKADRGEVELVQLPQGKNRDRAIAELQSDPSVAYAEPNWVYTTGARPNRKPGGGTPAPVPDYFSNGSLWGMYGDASAPANQFGSQAAEAWATGTTGSAAVYVGVIDEGIQFDHPDLAGQVWTNPFDTAGDGVDNDGNGYVDDVHGWDFANNDNTIYDGGTRGSLDDHGTHVSGTIGARNESTSPVPSTTSPQKGVVGVNQTVTLISGKFLGSNGGTTANAIKAVDYFTNLKTRHGLKIMATNNSWGGGGFSQALADAIVRAAQQNILFIAAAGNSGTDNDSAPSYPANYDTTTAAGYDSVIAVAAIDKTGALASFSQYGATTVDLGAPGVGVWSTTAYNGYSSYSGTSMATPHVTGGAALYASKNPTASAAMIKAAILDAARATLTPSLTSKTVTGGRLNVSGF